MAEVEDGVTEGGESMDEGVMAGWMGGWVDGGWTVLGQTDGRMDAQNGLEQKTR